MAAHAITDPDKQVLTLTNIANRLPELASSTDFLIRDQ